MFADNPRPVSVGVGVIFVEIEVDVLLGNIVANSISYFLAGRSRKSFVGGDSFNIFIAAAVGAAVYIL